MNISSWRSLMPAGNSHDLWVHLSTGIRTEPKNTPDKPGSIRNIEKIASVSHGGRCCFYVTRHRSTPHRYIAIILLSRIQKILYRSSSIECFLSKKIGLEASLNIFFTIRNGRLWLTIFKWFMRISVEFHQTAILSMQLHIFLEIYWINITAGVTIINAQIRISIDILGINNIHWNSTVFKKNMPLISQYS